MAGNQLVQSGYSRVFLLKNRASPQTEPEYEGLMRAAATTWDNGKITPIYIPDPNQYGKFRLAQKVSGEPGLPQITLEASYTTDLSEFLRLVSGNCDHDVQVHFGVCRNPQDFNGGWDKILMLEAARASSYGTNDLGALEPSQGGRVTETAKMDGQNLYEVKALTFAERAATQINDEVVGIVFCDSPSCGQCGSSSDGCQTLFAVTKSSGGSPGLLASLVFSIDGGTTWFTDAIDSLAANNAPTGLSCVGNNIIVISNAAVALEWAAISDVVAGIETWAQVVNGFVAAHGPNALISLTDTNTLIVGDGGYIYQAIDPTSGVSVLDGGIATTQNLAAISAADLDNVIAVGASNAVVVSTDGGRTWGSVTGPAVGVNLTCCWMASATLWWVGGSNGRLYYTTNGGVSWAEKVFPGSGSGVVRDIKFATDSVGYLAHSTTTPKGRVLRTLDGGFDWYVLPDGKAGIMPANQRITALATCGDANLIYGGGLATNATDGIIVKGS